MTRKLTLPDGGPMHMPSDGDKLIAPSATRNCDAVCNLVASFAAETGDALEIASGTGQHVVALARRLPGLSWQPTDVDPMRLRSIDAYARESGLTNILPAMALDASAPGWARAHGGKALVSLCNLLHLISDAEATQLLQEAAQAVGVNGHLILYGPFMRAGELTSEGDERFHASLQQQDPDIGYKDDFDVIDIVQAAGLDLVAAVEMPANNLGLVFTRPF
ncbi:DUF938 domain-containing protein [Mesobacterium pallidum]|uniref:DUF938 domain-containing protein n=1 Tax=Mesobacterium pallidum TaxID=2872037 RepID=UPI001EE1847A|nr:DUF938 domain-containing protein [Mesobacterium pallidum]